MTTDLAIAQKALSDVIAILNAANNPNTVFFEVGRATMTARLGLAQSGGSPLSETRHVPESLR
jgi:hypothetical protein